MMSLQYQQGYSFILGPRHYLQRIIHLYVIKGLFYQFVPLVFVDVLLNLISLSYWAVFVPQITAKSIMEMK